VNTWPAGIAGEPGDGAVGSESSGAAAGVGEDEPSGAEQARVEVDWVVGGDGGEDVRGAGEWCARTRGGTGGGVDPAAGEAGREARGGKPGGGRLATAGPGDGGREAVVPGPELGRAGPNPGGGPRGA
jgi:hypothetical protein